MSKKKKAAIAANPLEALRPLLDSHPKAPGEVYVPHAPFKSKGKTYALCLSCGAKDDRIMMSKHKKNCPWEAHWEAVEALRKLLESE